MGKITFLNKMDTRHFETEFGVNIHQRIIDGITFILENQEEAEKHARKINRYAFPVFEEGRTNGYWAVPR